MQYIITLCIFVLFSCVYLFIKAIFKRNFTVKYLYSLLFLILFTLVSVFIYFYPLPMNSLTKTVNIEEIILNNDEVYLNEENKLKLEELLINLNLRRDFFDFVITSKEQFLASDTVFIRMYTENQKPIHITIPLNIPSKAMLWSNFKYYALLNQSDLISFFEKLDKTTNMFTQELYVNIPNSVRKTMSLSINKKGIENTYGKADSEKIFDKKTYELRNIADGSKLIITYLNNRVIDMWQFKKIFDRSDFEKLEINKSSLDDVLKIDLYSTIIGSDEHSITEHKLKNNEVVLITYKNIDDLWIITEIEFLENDSSELFKGEDKLDFING